MTPARFRWGLLLILIGLLWLLRNADVLTDDFWPELLLYLPVVLIAVGIEKIFTKSRLSFISYLTSVVLFTGALYIAFAFGMDGGRGSFFSESTFERPYDPDVRLIEATLELGETDLTIRDSGDDLVFGRFDRFTRKPRVDYRIEGDGAKVTFTSRPHRFLGGIVSIEGGEKPNWYLQFARDIPLKLECFGDEADLHLNFATTPLQRLKLDAADSRVYLKLGDLTPVVDVDIVGRDSNLRLRVPQHVGLKILGEEYRSYLEHLGLETSNGGFITPGFDTVENRIEVRLDDRLASFSIDFF
ncbi:MAG: DUF5668 domain-containing protein [Candidatus Zixiibacteriota bacterium]